MPAGYLIDLQHKLVLSRAWGVLTEAQLVGHAQALAKDPQFAPSHRQLVDFRDVTRAEVTTGTVRLMATISPFGTGSRRALICGEETIGSAQLFEMLREPVADTVRVFRQISAGIEWLGLAEFEASIVTSLADVPETILAGAE